MANATYPQWLAEKLWELIPSIYRHEDGLADTPHVLRSLVEVMAEQAAIVRRSQDRLWDDQFIETADDWAVPYLADLVGTRLVRALDPRGRRIDVAKTIYYRRRSGTLRVLEELIADIAGWEGRSVEQFRRLARTPHRLDPPPRPVRWQTPAGGLAELRNPGLGRRIGGPFDGTHHLPETRRHRGSLGRYGIPKLAFHLYRLTAYQVEDVTPAEVTDTATLATLRTFDPSGRAIALFARRSRAPSWDDWHAAREWELPLPIRCRLLGQAAYVLDEAGLAELGSEGLSAPAQTDLRPYLNVTFADEASLRRVIASLPAASSLLAGGPADVALYRSLLDKAVTPDSAKPKLVPDSLHVSEAAGPIPHVRTAAGSLAGGATPSAYAKDLVIDAERGLWHADAPEAVTGVTYCYGFSGPLGAGPYARTDLPAPDHSYAGGGSGLLASTADNDRTVAIADSATYEGVTNKTAITRMAVQAADGRRPYLHLDADWQLQASPAGTVDDEGHAIDSVLTLDGLWIGAHGTHDMMLGGNFERVTIRRCTIDPGGVDAGDNALHCVSIRVRGHVEELIVERSVLGPIRVDAGGTLERLHVRDSIVASEDPGDPSDLALDVGTSEVRLERVTVLGALRAHRLWSDAALVTGVTRVTDTQAGCVRFSALRRSATARVPHPYETHRFDSSAGLFTSERFGDAGYAQLSAACPEAIRTGAEDGSEIGAFSALQGPIKRAGLLTKVHEFMPFGLIPLLIDET